MKLSEVYEGEEFRFLNTPDHDVCIKRKGKLEYEREWYNLIRNEDGDIVRKKLATTTYAVFYGDQFDVEVELI